VLVFSSSAAAVTATYLFSSITAVPHTTLRNLTNSPDPTSSSSSSSSAASAVIVVDDELLACKSAGGPSAAAAGSVAAELYEWLDIAASNSFPEEVLAAVAAPGVAKYHGYGGGRHVIHVGAPDFRSAEHASSTQEEAEAVLSAAYTSILRQFLMAVSELEEGACSAVCCTRVLCCAVLCCTLFCSVLCRARVPSCTVLCCDAQARARLTTSALCPPVLCTLCVLCVWPALPGGVVWCRDERTHTPNAGRSERRR
jgi:hypothetical protein